MEKLEIRTCSRGFEVREDGDGLPTISGYAAVFNRETDLGWFLETVKKGAFKRALTEGQDVRALVDHDPSKIVARTKNGTLTLKEDRTGLKAEFTPSDTTAGRDIVESIRRGDVDGMSFGFRVVEDRWRKKDGRDLRELLDVDLFDVSVVTYPAYQDTEVSLRSLNEVLRDAHKPLVAIGDGTGQPEMSEFRVDVNVKVSVDGKEEEEAEAEAGEERQAEADADSSTAAPDTDSAVGSVEEEREENEVDTSAVMAMRKRRIDLARKTL